MRTLTYVEAKALREATDVCFDLDRGGSQIRAIHKDRNGDYSDETTTTIAGVPADVIKYDGAGDCYGFDMIMNAQHVPEWRTVCKRLRMGATISLRWVRGNSSPVTREAGLVVDHLNIIVNGDAYRIRDYVGYDNSARMTRPYRTN